MTLVQLKIRHDVANALGQQVVSEKKSSVYRNFRSSHPNNAGVCIQEATDAKVYRLGI